MAKNYCPACGARLQQGDMSCPACGRALEQEEAAEAAVKGQEHTAGAAAAAVPPSAAPSALSAGPAGPEEQGGGAPEVKRDAEDLEPPYTTLPKEQQEPTGQKEGAYPPPVPGAVQPGFTAQGWQHPGTGPAAGPFYGAAPLPPNAGPGQGAGRGTPPGVPGPFYAQQGPGAQPNASGQPYARVPGAPQRPFYMPPPAQTGAAYMPRYGQPGPGGAPVPGQGAGEMPEPVSMGTYLGMALLGSIPVAGLILLLVWSFDAAPRPNRRNFARGFLVARLILSALFGAMLFLVFLLLRLPHIVLY